MSMEATIHRYLTNRPLSVHELHDASGIPLVYLLYYVTQPGITVIEGSPIRFVIATV